MARRVAARALNPMMLRLAGRRHFYAARLEHVGRKSGRTYATPVVALRVPEGLAVPLPYGPGVDWHRNLEAAGTAVLTADGVRYRLSSPRTVPAEEVLATLSPTRRTALGAIGEFVVVHAEPIPAS
ncbi:nitroreductase [Pseudonocardia xishanensis]|uniref:Deazaflavin-dependent oxidoreductase (Nitroreductase family) n=1 Tax=Pseudonocardia xishanensis TaxID=630995 RepID=A0ABP8RX65_9PSEU